MAVRISSLLVSGPVTVPLVSGETVRLSPGEESADLPEVEVTGSAKVTKLRERGLIKVETVSEADATEREADEIVGKPTRRTRSPKTTGSG
ncbi:hypothetical protein [Streptomyces sp. NRRL S-646]|uniref:hypothetical protein n=1 Tax=Streptomyces sp. NRRL S-646 TaxID=1463917 RepID=UPI0004C5A023|nr:hypothetical protein [Streptomyces sp. NRRL S-646]